MIMAPLDCQIVSMNSGLEVLRILDSDLFTTSNSKGSTEVKVNEGERITGSSILGTDTEIFSEAQGSAVTDKDAAGVDADVHASIQNKAVGIAPALPAGATTGFSVGTFLNNIGTDKPSFLDLSYPEQFLVGMIEVKDYITHYK